MATRYGRRATGYRPRPTGYGRAGDGASCVSVSGPGLGMSGLWSETIANFVSFTTHTLLPSRLTVKLATFHATSGLVFVARSGVPPFQWRATSLKEVQGNRQQTMCGSCRSHLDPAGNCSTWSRLPTSCASHLARTGSHWPRNVIGFSG